MPTSWFAVDHDGLRELVAAKPAWFAIAELAQNSWDEDSTKVSIMLEKLPGRPAARLVVEDDNPEGFRNLTHAFTLFARSDKRSDPEKRGRFNLGEKLVLARCIEAEVSTTKGTVVFNQDGTRTRRRLKRDQGTVFTGIIRMNSDEFLHACSAVQMLHPPIPTTFNGILIEQQTPIKTFEAKLPTVMADQDGALRRTTRKTEIRIYKVRSNSERPCIYEMGIPVVATDDAYHVDVQQKVPLNMDRDNVPPSYLRKLRAVVLNHTADLLSNYEITESWVDAALEDSNIKSAAVQTVIKARFGNKVVTADPSDREAENNAKAAGYRVIHGGSFSKRQWEAIKQAEVMPPAGQVFPTKHVEYSAGGTPEKIIPVEDWTKEMQAVATIAEDAARTALDIRHLSIIMVNDPKHNGNRFAAWYCDGRLHFNYRVLGKSWFRKQNREQQLELIIHELAHAVESNHLSTRYHEACCNIGAKLVLWRLRT
ncbi:hypothetical protein LCGC14_0823490 [marine sediment metagenome]|uniref:Uncharacterized protein n=1 Tax=marine sediment metagenome TaxID=412755 RepID=A0A0F9S2X6_9ZZZZ